MVAFDHLRDALSVIFGLSVTQGGHCDPILEVLQIGIRAEVIENQISSPFANLSDMGSPGVDGPPIMPDDPYAYVVAAFQNSCHRTMRYSQQRSSHVCLLPPPTEQSPGYILESDPEEGPKEDNEIPEEDPAGSTLLIGM
ncbi:hypothetical protein Tco_0739553 [Tanacetum coccineum]